MLSASATRASRVPGTNVSPEQAMHKPFRLGRLAAPQALAIKPETAPFPILGAEIVARRRSRVAPPGRGDAFRPLDGGDIMQDSPPAEAQRRPVGHFGERLDRLWAGKEAQRPRRRAAATVSGPSLARPRFPNAAGAAASACSGRCASMSSRRVTARAPSRAHSRSRSSASA